jgi:hypothetical protein
MMRTLALLLMIAIAPSSPAETISVGSRQFEVDAPSAVLAEKAADRAESIRRTLYSLTGQPNNFITPIRVNFQEVELGDDLDDFDYVVQADAAIGSWQFSIAASKDASEGSEIHAWPEAVVTSIQYELANRVRGKKGGGLVTWPAWYLWGMTALADDEMRGEMGRLWEERYQRKTYRTLEQIWRSSGSETGREKERLQVLAAWLIVRLRELPEGPAKLSKLAHEINRGNFSPETFYKIFAKDFPAREDGERWWTRQQAAFQPGSKVASLDLDSTCARIREILEQELPEPGVKGLREEDMEEVNDIHRQLMRLTVAGHPMAKPAIETALRALDLLRANDTARARPSWENARSILDALAPWGNQIKAVLDRHEYSSDSLSAQHWLARKGLAD